MSLATITFLLSCLTISSERFEGEQSKSFEELGRKKFVSCFELH